MKSKSMDLMEQIKVANILSVLVESDGAVSDLLKMGYSSKRIRHIQARAVGICMSLEKLKDIYISALLATPKQ